MNLSPFTPFFPYVLFEDNKIITASRILFVVLSVISFILFYLQGTSVVVDKTSDIGVPDLVSDRVSSTNY